jgi:VIT1/CCC1 family predicted Fe2+/Mn2+ transporter
MTGKPEDIARYRRNLRDEEDGAALYAALARAEPDPVRRDLFEQLADSERRHADVWRTRLAQEGIVEPPRPRSFRTRVLAGLARRFGPGFVLPSVAAGEVADRNKYAGQSDAQDISGEERGHAAVVQAALGGGRPGFSGRDIAKAEKWHRGASGNELRAAVLGANDGLVSNFCLIMGVAGAEAAGRTILLTGLAGLIAGACSMALGEWLSVTNARELAASQMAREKEELELTPEAEVHELALIYQAKGIDRESAKKLANQLMTNKETALDTLAREELGIDPEELGGNPWSAAGTSFLLFAGGALVPLLPFLWTGGTTAIALCALFSAVGLAVIGTTTALFNGRSAPFSAARQVVIGSAAAAATYGVGVLLGVTIS